MGHMYDSFFYTDPLSRYNAWCVKYLSLKVPGYYIGSCIVAFLQIKVHVAVAESVGDWSCTREIVGSMTGRVKAMTYKIDPCHFLARCLA